MFHRPRRYIRSPAIHIRFRKERTGFWLALSIITVYPVKRSCEDLRYRFRYRSQRRDLRWGCDKVNLSHARIDLDRVTPAARCNWDECLRDGRFVK